MRDDVNYRTINTVDSRIADRVVDNGTDVTRAAAAAHAHRLAARLCQQPGPFERSSSLESSAKQAGRERLAFAGIKPAARSPRGPFMRRSTMSRSRLRRAG